MRYLIDTNILIWIIEDPTMLSHHTLHILRDPKNKICIGVSSIGEIAIKTSKKNLNLCIDIDGLYRLIKNKGFIILPVKQKHINGILKLPQIHKDPFDRLLISTAISEKLHFITSDRNIHLYNVRCIW